MKMLMAGLAVVRKEGNINNEKTVFLATSCSESVRNKRECGGGWQKEKLERITKNPLGCQVQGRRS